MEILYAKADLSAIQKVAEFLKGLNLFNVHKLYATSKFVIIVSVNLTVFGCDCCLPVFKQPRERDVDATPGSAT